MPADAIVDLLNALQIEIAAELSSIPVAVSLDSTTWRSRMAAVGRVLIVPGTETITKITRLGNRHDLAIDLVWEKPILTPTPPIEDQIRGNLRTRETILTLWDESEGERGRLRGKVIAGATMVGFQPRALWTTPLMDEELLFRSLITPIYRFGY